MILVCFQGKQFITTVNQVCAPTANAEEAEVQWFYDDLQDLLEPTSVTGILFGTSFGMDGYGDTPLHAFTRLYTPVAAGPEGKVVFLAPCSGF